MSYSSDASYTIRTRMRQVRQRWGGLTPGCNNGGPWTCVMWLV